MFFFILKKYEVDMFRFLLVYVKMIKLGYIYIGYFRLKECFFINIGKVVNECIFLR